MKEPAVSPPSVLPQQTADGRGVAETPFGALCWGNKVADFLCVFGGKIIYFPSFCKQKCLIFD